MNQSTFDKLKTLQEQEAFYFCDSPGSYTGHKAYSLGEFAEEIGKIDLKSLEFHLFREDFEKWIAFSLKDDTLAKSVEALRKQTVNGENLRSNLQAAVTRRLDALRKPAKSTKTTKRALNNQK